MQITEQIVEWSKEALEPEVFIVEVEHKNAGGKLMVYIDSEGPLTIEQCRKLNKFLSLKLDEIDFGLTPYTLEVSSPGVDRPLKVLRQYNKHIGRELSIVLKAKTEFLGKLISVNANGIAIQLKDKKKAYNAPEPTLKEILFEEMETAIVQVSFN
jgi:ribosome maturation factor RimP